MKIALIVLGAVALLFLTGVLSISSGGCTLPVDLVLFRSACVFGSLGASLGLTLAATLFFGVISLVFAGFRNVVTGNGADQTASGENPLLHATYSLAAAVTCADGTVDSRELAVAEGIGEQLFDDFSGSDLRLHCENQSAEIDIAELSRAVGNVLKIEHKELILKYLEAISEADGVTSIEEKNVLESIADGFGISSERYA